MNLTPYRLYEGKGNGNFMNKSVFYNMNLPEGSDFYNVNDFNANTILIDEEMHDFQVHTENKSNPHGVTKSQVGLGNVGNFKAVSTVANQGLTTTEKANARTNIGAGTSNFSGSYNDLTDTPTIPTVNNATLTIQKNGTTVKTFTANASSAVTANITVPTKTSELTNDSGYITNAGVTGVKGSSETTYRTGQVNITKSNIGLGSVGNFKAVSTVASQGLTATEKSNARTNIGTDKQLTYKSALDYGLDNTGATDCSTILKTVTGNIGFPVGTYLINKDCTINAQVVISDGAVLNIASGRTLTINGQILAGRYTIFGGAGSVVVDEGQQEFGYPEWFGDSIAKCYNTFRYIKLARKVYTVDGDLVINKSNSKIEGVCYPTNIIGDCTILNFTNNARIVIGRSDTITIADFPRNITLSKLFIIGTTSLDCISIYGVVRALVEQCYLWTQTAFSGISFYRAIASTCRDVYIQSVGVSGTFMGYRFVDEHGGGYPGARAASIWLINCTYADTNPQNGNTFGFHIGKHLSDVYLTNCEVAEANVGISFDGLENAYSVDFLITGCDFDMCRSSAIQVYNCSKGMINISNCYGANVSSVTNPVMNIINSTCQVVVNGLQIILTKNGANAITAGSNSVMILDGVNIINNDGISGTTAITTTSSNVKGKYIFNGVVNSI